MQTVELVFEQFGEQHETCPLIILHGFFASSRNWRSLAKKLAAKHRVYVLNLRNHGDSPHSLHMDYPSMAADVALFMDNQNLASAAFLGHSMGGKIAMWFALNFSDRVEKLIIADISPVSYQHNFDTTINALKDLPLAEFTNRKQLEEWLAPVIDDQTYRQFLLHNLLFEEGNYQWRINLDYFQHNAHHIVAFPDAAAITAFQKPVLFLAGEHSQYVQEEAVYRLFPAATIEELAGAGHWLHVQSPEIFCLKVEDWLGS
jgi:esterase